MERYNISIAGKKNNKKRNIGRINPNNLNSPQEREEHNIEEEEKNGTTLTKYSPSRVNNLTS